MGYDHIPAEYHSVTPYLVLKNAKDAVEFYKRAFDAEERGCLMRPDGMVGHAEIKIGNSILMLADEVPEMGFLGPETRGGTPISLLIYVPDADAAFARAIEAGATEVRPVSDQFYGDRSGMIQDPFGYVWNLAMRKEEIAIDEIQRRMTEMMGGEA